MKLILPVLILITGVQFAQAASATVNQWLEAEAIEICHREGGTPETCGDIPLD